MDSPCVTWTGMQPVKQQEVTCMAARHASLLEAGEAPVPEGCNSVSAGSWGPSAGSTFSTLQMLWMLLLASRQPRSGVWCQSTRAQFTQAPATARQHKAHSCLGLVRATLDHAQDAHRTAARAGCIAGAPVELLLSQPTGCPPELAHAG